MAEVSHLVAVRLAAIVVAVPLIVALGAPFFILAARIVA
jgi:hypothetical protein